MSERGDRIATIQPPPADNHRPHVTLVLGAGGPIGQAFHVGVLRALADGGGWDARQADVIIGTSAGAHIGALLRAGWEAHRMVQRLMRPPLRPQTNGRRWPASSAYLRNMLRHPTRARLGPLVAALLPEGTHDSAPVGAAFRELFHGHWPRLPLWIPAVRVDTGTRVVFGREDAPLVDVGTAVRCSSAVPGLRRPVEVGAHRYVNGGMLSPTHADLAVTGTSRPRHVIIVLSPLSKFAPLRALLRWELRGVARQGFDVLLFEPDRAVAAVMGWNPLDGRAALEVAEAAYAATLARLRREDASVALQLLGGA